MKTANPEFSSVQPRSERKIKEQTLYDMKAYQAGLINQLLYEPLASKSGQKSKVGSDRIIAEIKRVENWLKVQWDGFFLDNQINEIIKNI